MRTPKTVSNDPVRFNTQLLQTGATTTGIPVPAEVIAKLASGARPAVLVRVNGYSYRTTVGVMRGQSLLPFSAQHRDLSGIQGGDAIQVEIERDTQPRTAELPADLDRALSEAGVLAAFEKLAPSRQRSDVDNVAGAKNGETRVRRIAAIVAKLRA